MIKTPGASGWDRRIMDESLKLLIDGSPEGGFWTADEMEQTLHYARQIFDIAAVSVIEDMRRLDAWHFGALLAAGAYQRANFRNSMKTEALTPPWCLIMKRM